MEIQLDISFAALLNDKCNGQSYFTIAIVETEWNLSELWITNVTGAQTPSGPCAMASKPSFAPSITGQIKSPKFMKLETQKAETGNNSIAPKDFMSSKQQVDWESNNKLF